uniref:Uncharacterized protein n=1 Tax=Caenorhabditis japonica TaxID=281687 RepID=A0A8R1IBK6_CAEJA
MFEGGVACFNCPYGCELSEDNEGYVVEGDLCLAPKSDKMGNADGGDVLLSGAENSIWTVLLVIALILLINK